MLAKLESFLKSPIVRATATIVALGLAAYSDGHPELAGIAGLVLGALHVKRPGDTAP